MGQQKIQDKSQPPRVLNFFDRQAGRFPEIGGESACRSRRAIDALFRRSLRLRFERVLQRCLPVEGRSVLDVGCGTGTYAVGLASSGANRVVGIDFAPRMIELAKRRAEDSGVTGLCEFMVADFATYQPLGSFDFVVVMGVMDYIGDAAEFITRAVHLADRAAFVSFPKSGGILAWQRRMRYRRKCPLYMYSRDDVEALLRAVCPGRFEIESMARDWFVTIHGEGA